MALIIGIKCLLDLFLRISLSEAVRMFEIDFVALFIAILFFVVLFLFLGWREAVLKD